MAHALISRLDELVDDGKITEFVYKELADLVKKAKDGSRDALLDDIELEAMAPLLRANIGDTFSHHAYEGRRGYSWMGEDQFNFLGRADGTTRVPKGWWLFRINEHVETRGICQEGSNQYAGCNGGMLDAVDAWPIADYRNYAVDGTFDDKELALPAEKCWGFRRVQYEEMYSEGEENEEDEAEAQKQDEEPGEEYSASKRARNE